VGKSTHEELKKGKLHLKAENIALAPEGTLEEGGKGLSDDGMMAKFSKL
jgi:hypothetical protein